MIPAAAIASLSSRLSGSDDEYRVASVPIDLEPIDLVRSASDTHVHVACFGVPGQYEIASVGSAWQSVAGHGDSRHRDAWLEFKALGLPPQARAMVGFSFSPAGTHDSGWSGFSNTMTVLPLISVGGPPDGRHLTVVLAPGRSKDAVLAEIAGWERPAPVQPVHAGDTTIESRPHPDVYTASVAAAVDEIRAGSFDKVVLARSVEVRTDWAPRPFDLVHELRRRYPGCYVFGWQQADRAFVGASPELLVQRRGDLVRSHPLAGTTARGEGEEEDTSLAETLMVSLKDRAEHRLVVDDIASRLATVARDLHVDATPSLRRLTHIQHLSSEVSGTLSHDMSVLELAGLLHPTPAIGGSPRVEALDFLAKQESFDRGWYGGGIGWLEPDGDGEIALALRCGLVNGERTTLFAGAGIVADSDPEQELAETRLKFRPMLELLTQA